VESWSKTLWPSRHGLTIVFVLALAVQVQAAMTLRGLYADGAFFGTQILASRGIDVFQPARWVGSVILQLPVVTAMGLGVRGTHRLMLAFSLSTNLLPGLGFLQCLAILPKLDRRFFVFPAFVYFAGTLSAGFASVTEGLVATAYLWVLLCLLVFGRSTLWRSLAILSLSIGTLRLHEEVLFLGPILAAASYFRLKTESRRFDRAILVVATVALLGGAAIGAAGVVFPRYAGGPGDFASNFLHFHWLYVPGAGVNLPALLGILAVLAMLPACAVPAVAGAAFGVFTVVAAVLSVAAFRFDWLTVPAAQFFARDNAAFISLVLMILLLVARRHPMLDDRLFTAPLGGIVMALGLAVSLWHVSATVKWDTFREAFAQRLAAETGVIPWSRMLMPPGSRDAKLSAMMVWPWTNPDLSLLVLPRHCVRSIIANPRPSSWQPYNPADPRTMPAIPGIKYVYLLPPDHQSAACADARSAP
jgi:hypothetical protein